MPRRALCNVLAALFSILVIMPLVVMILDRELPVKLTYGELKPTVIYANPASGAQVTVSWSVQRMRKFGNGILDCQGTFYRRIIDAAGYVTETKPGAVQSIILIGDKEIGAFTKDVSLPPLTPGAATYRIITQYWCNPIQKYLFPINHQEELIHFMVLPDPRTTGQKR